MAAEAAAGAGAEVTIVDQRRSFGRTLLLAGRSGLNLTHAEPLEVFLGRYGDGRVMLEPAIRAFPPDAVRAWADELGADTFVGSSGRVFPADASHRSASGLDRPARGLGVAMRTGETWAGFTDDGATVLALGGASWPSVGGDGSWLAHVETAGIPVVPFAASNAGVLVAWSAPLSNVSKGCRSRTPHSPPEVAPFEANRRSPQPAWKAARSTRWARTSKRTWA